MAFPTVHDLLEQVQTDGTSPFSVNMPTTVNNGDKLIVIMVKLDGSTTIPTPTGWNEIAQDQDLSNLGTTAVFTRNADGSEGGTSVDFSISDNAACHVYRISGWNDLEISSSATNNTANPNPGPLSPSWGAQDTLWLAVTGSANDGETFTGYPTNYTNGNYEKSGGTANQHVAVASARRELNATSDDPGTFTMGNQDQWVAYTIAIKPETVGLPTGTDYATPSSALPDPDSDLTDIILIVDLSLMPQSWWNSVDTSDPTKGRASKDDASEDSATQLAADWQDFDNVNETGIVYVKWSGVNSSTNTESLRLYPPKSENQSYAVGDTYGRNAVWSDYAAVWHMNSDPTGTAPQLTDVSGNGANATASGTWSSGNLIDGALGGKALAFEESDSRRFDYSPVVQSSGTTQYTFSVLAWARLQQLPSTISVENIIISQEESAGNNTWYLYANTPEDNPRFLFEENGDFGIASGSTNSLTANVWEQYVGLADVSDRWVYFNGSQAGFNGATITPQNISDGYLGADVNGADYFDGDIEEVWIYNSLYTADEISYLYDQGDQSTFWGGTWNWGLTTTVSANQGSFTLTGQDATLLKTSKLEANQGSFSLTGQSANIAKRSTLVAEQGSFTMSTATVELLTDTILSAEQGSYTLTGQDVGILSQLVLLAEQGSYSLNGQAATIAKKIRMVAGSGSYTITGFEVIFGAAAGAVTLSDGRVFEIPFDDRTYYIKS